MNDIDRLYRECCEQIRSVLATQNEGLSVRQFVSDFKQLTFKAEIPYRQFGFSSLEEFLWSIPHVCTPVGSDGCIDRLYAVTSGNTAKVQEMNTRHHVKRGRSSAGVAFASRPPRFAERQPFPLDKMFTPVEFTINDAYNDKMIPYAMMHHEREHNRYASKCLPPALMSLSTTSIPPQRDRRDHSVEYYDFAANSSHASATHSVKESNAIAKIGGWKVNGANWPNSSNGNELTSHGKKQSSSSSWVGRDENMNSSPVCNKQEDAEYRRKTERQAASKKSMARPDTSSRRQVTEHFTAGFGLTQPFAADIRTTKAPPGLKAIQRTDNSDSDSDSRFLSVPIHEYDLHERFGATSSSPMHLVSVCYVVTLDEFYVQLVDEKHVLETVNNQLNEGGALRTSSCAFGELLASLNESRRRIGTNRTPQKAGFQSRASDRVCFAVLSSNARYLNRARLVNEHDGLFEVLLIDTGERCQVPPSRIFAIDDRFALLQRPGLAYRCRLPIATTARRLLGDEDTSETENQDDIATSKQSSKSSSERSATSHFKWLISRTDELHMRVLSVDNETQTQSLVVDLLAYAKSPVSIARILHEFRVFDIDLNLWSPLIVPETAQNQVLHVNGSLNRMVGDRQIESYETVTKHADTDANKNEYHAVGEKTAINHTPIGVLPIGGFDLQGKGGIAQHVAVHVVHVVSPSYFACVPYEAADAMRDLIALMQIAFSVTDPRSNAASQTIDVDACGQRIKMSCMQPDCLYAAYVDLDPSTEELFGETCRSLWLRVILVDDKRENGVCCCLCIDYGKTVMLSEDCAVYALPEEFATCSWQTNVFALGDVVPLEQGGGDGCNYETARRCGIFVAPVQRTAWCDEARRAFARLTLGKDFFALLPDNVDPFGSVIPVRLVDTSGSEDVLINELIVSSGFGVYSNNGGDTESQ